MTIAKVDATANDVPDEISGFPTIKLFPAGSKDSPIDYQGSRTVEGLADFIKENGKYKVDAYVANDTDADMTDADDTMGKQAPAATGSGAAESVKSVASEAAEAVKTMITDTDDGGKEAHDEL